MSSDTPLPAVPSSDMKGRVAIVTGGSRGIGRAIARGLADRGASVVVASRKADVCETVAAEFRDEGYDAIGVATHVGELEDLASLRQAAVDAYGRIDMLVNNAATGLAQPLGEMTPEAWLKSFNVNLRGPVFLIQECLPELRNSPHASVLNILSAGAFQATPEVAMYGAAKLALLSFTRSMARAFAPDGIRVNALAPGTVDTAMTRAGGEKNFERLTHASWMDRIAVPEEMVGPALLLLGDGGSYITGQCLNADGGMVIAR